LCAQLARRLPPGKNVEGRVRIGSSRGDAGPSTVDLGLTHPEMGMSLIGQVQSLSKTEWFCLD
jgi:hypothetical protein